jgi:hypothetical protein
LPKRLTAWPTEDGRRLGDIASVRAPPVTWTIPTGPDIGGPGLSAILAAELERFPRIAKNHQSTGVHFNLKPQQRAFCSLH